MGFHFSILYILSFVLSVRCCISFGNSGCLSSGATLGGKLVFTGESGQDVAEPPSWIAGRKLVFIKESFPQRRTFGLGRGRIWIGKRGCRDGFCQNAYVDSTQTLPCFEDLVDKSNIPSYSGNRAHVLQFFDVTPTSINVTWPAWDQGTDLGSGPISEYRIQFKEAQQTEFITISMGTSLSYLFENLREDTDYEFRVVIFRDHATHGEGPPSSVQTQRTLPKQNVPSYSQNRTDLLRFSDVTSTSINVTWPAWNQGTDIGSGPISEYRIQFREVTETEFRTISAGLSLSYRFENLTEDTVYEFRVVIFSDHPNGEGPPSPEQTFKTPCGVHAEDVSLNLTTPTRRRGKLLVAKWKIAERQPSCGTINKTLFVELKDLDRCPVDSAETNFVDLTAAAVKKILGQRKPNSLYKVTLSVAYGGEFYNKSEEIRTLETEPTSAPENLMIAVAEMSAGRLTFQWTEPPCGGRNGVITKFETSFTKNGHEQKDSTTATSKTFSDLIEGDIYTFKVKAENRKGKGPYTEPGCTSVFGTDICGIVSAT